MSKNWSDKFILSFKEQVYQNNFCKSLEVLGSWSSDLDAKGIKRQKVLEKKIEEAMLELAADGETNGFQVNILRPFLGCGEKKDIISAKREFIFLLFLHSLKLLLIDMLVYTHNK